MELELKGNLFRTGELDAFDQLHIARKLSYGLIPLDGVTRKGNEGKDKQLLTLLMFSKMDDSDADYVMKKCLSTVLLQQGETWVKVVKGDSLMFGELISLADMLKLSLAVIEENLGDFFRTALSGLEREAKA
jgi:hypothetical protein